MKALREWPPDVTTLDVIVRGPEGAMTEWKVGHTVFLFAGGAQFCALSVTVPFEFATGGGK